MDGLVIPHSNFVWRHSHFIPMSLSCHSHIFIMSFPCHSHFIPMSWTSHYSFLLLNHSIFCIDNVELSDLYYHCHCNFEQCIFCKLVNNIHCTDGQTFYISIVLYIHINFMSCLFIPQGNVLAVANKLIRILESLNPLWHQTYRHCLLQLLWYSQLIRLLCYTTIVHFKLYWMRDIDLTEWHQHQYQHNSGCIITIHWTLIVKCSSSRALYTVLWMCWHSHRYYTIAM